MTHERLAEYARLLVQSGIRPEPGQKTVITASTGQAELVRLLTEECYKAGCPQVRVDWTDDELTRLHYQYQSEEDLGTLPPWRIQRQEQDADDLVCILYIVDQDPDALKSIDAQKMLAVRQMQYPVLKPIRDRIENRYQWLIAAASSPAWAAKVFPELDTEAAVERLWEEIFRACRMDGQSDPVEAWEQHDALLAGKSSTLNSLELESVHYKSSNGTDFTCGLIPGARWEGGEETSDLGRRYNPNMPTEEVFTTPMRGRAHGRVVATKPLSYQGQIIEDFWIEFEEGKAVRWDAAIGRENLDSMLTADEGAAYIGELALVPKDSPISQSGVLFFNTLFDENASCHIAMGRGFTNLIPGYEKMSEAELLEAGCNTSMIHTDFMIGSDDLVITGRRRDGSEVTIFDEGRWAI